MLDYACRYRTFDIRKVFYRVVLGVPVKNVCPRYTNECGSEYIVGDDEASRLGFWIVWLRLGFFELAGNRAEGAVGKGESADTDKEPWDS